MKRKSILLVAILILILTLAGTLSACFNVDEVVKVNFVIDDKVEATVELSDNAKLPVIAAKEGLTLSKWYFDKEFTEKFSFAKLIEKALTSEVSVYAKWIPNQYTIAFECNGGSPVDEITATFGKNIGLPDAPIKDGYIFGGWFSDNNVWTQPFTVDSIISSTTSETLTVYAKWIPNQYTIAFDTNGGSTVADITADYGAAVSKPSNPTRDGHAFAGWFTDNTFTNEFIFDTMPLDGATVYAKWLEAFDIIYSLDGGTNNNSNPNTYTVEDEITFEIPAKLGHTFVGWFDSEIEALK